MRAIAVMANCLGTAATAEGAETEEQFDHIRSEGCTEMQGFLFSKPRPAHEIGQLPLGKAAERRPEATADAA